VSRAVLIVRRRDNAMKRNAEVGTFLRSRHSLPDNRRLIKSSCTHRSLSTGRSGRLRHAPLGWLPAPGCCIAMYPNRATDTAKLSPVGLQPCRLLRRSCFNSMLGGKHQIQLQHNLSPANNRPLDRRLADAQPGCHLRTTHSELLDRPITQHASGPHH